jgi:AcrR family transcriptional regulator
VPRPKQRTPALRDELIRSALSTLREHGPSGFTTRRVARDAGTSVPAVYELFGDKSGLVRELFFEGFRRLRAENDRLRTTDDAIGDVQEAVWAFRRFVQENPDLAEVMFLRPFADFDPTPDDVAVGAATRQFLVDRVRRAVDEGLLVGRPTDIAHGVLALALGLATQEAAGWLGTSKASIDRRWRNSVVALIDGFRPSG